jgi:hypothetical protein
MVQRRTTVCVCIGPIGDARSTMISPRVAIARCLLSRARLLLAEMDEVHRRLRQPLAGLTNDEPFWEPC